MLDLHLHTRASDGADTPEQLAEKLSAAGISVCAVTDHDEIAGVLELEQLAPAGLQIIRGVEFSCESPGGKCHILGYGFDHTHPAFVRIMECGTLLRRQKLQARLQYLRNRFGFVPTEAEMQWLLRRSSPGKPHLGRLLVAHGLAPDLKTAIEQGLNPFQTGDARLPAADAVNAILQSGGIPVWAHPLGGEGERRLSEAAFSKQLSELLACGIRGLECWYSRYRKQEIDFLLRQARDHGLLVSGGSDYHGIVKPDLRLGMLSADGSVPQADVVSLLDALREHHT